MTQSIVRSTDDRRRDGPDRERTSLFRRVAALGLSLLLLLTARPVMGQGQGEVQVTARVLPLVQSREAAIDFAVNRHAPESSPLFHITRLTRPESRTTPDFKREELIVVVEFLAN